MAALGMMMAHGGQPAALRRILGIGFGIAVVIGGTIGVGILRSPGAVAAQLGSSGMVILVWILGGLYTLLAANSMAELATMMPKAGGPYVYARRAYGDYGGFVVGWTDWLFNTLALSYMVIVFGEYAASLFAPFPGNVQVFAVAILLSIAGLNWIGLRFGSEAQKLASLLKALALIGFVIACFAIGGPDQAVHAPAAGREPRGLPLLVGGVLALQLVIGAYGGWAAVVYFAEEDTHPQRNIPRALFGGIVLIMAIYLLVNIALLHVLPIQAMAASKFAGADAIGLMFGARGGQIVTILALLSIAGIINALLMFVPRILLALGRDGLFLRKAATVNAGGTPVVATGATVLVVFAMAIVGSFETLLAVSEFFAVTILILLNAALFLLRKREPHLLRPYRAWGYPLVPALALLLSVAVFAGYILGNPRYSFYAVIVLACSYPLYRIVIARPARETPKLGIAD